MSSVGGRNTRNNTNLDGKIPNSNPVNTSSSNLVGKRANSNAVNTSLSNLDGKRSNSRPNSNPVNTSSSNLGGKRANLENNSGIMINSINVSGNTLLNKSIGVSDIDIEKTVEKIYTNSMTSGIHAKFFDDNIYKFFKKI